MTPYIELNWTSSEASAKKVANNFGVKLVAFTETNNWPIAEFEGKAVRINRLEAWYNRGGDMREI